MQISLPWTAINRQMLLGQRGRVAIRRRVLWIAVMVALSVGGLAHGAVAQMAQLVISGARLYASPTSSPMDKATIIIRHGKIAEIRADQRAVPVPTERMIEAEGLVVMAGFWNCHVHFTQSIWNDASDLSEADLNAYLSAMLTRYGFTSVVDTGSDLANTQAIRKRIDLGVKGPQILMASGSFVPENGSPAYLRVKLPELIDVKQAQQQARQVLARGADAIKLFTGSFLGPSNTALMSLPLIAAVAQEAHQQGKLVLAHPQSRQGVERALEGGVDVLVHTAPTGGAWPDTLVERLVRRGMGMVPTLKLWRFELTRVGVPADIVDRYQATGVEQLRAFAAAGGEVLFGTDVGYMTDYDPTEEYRKMAEAGLDVKAILAALTLNPARRFDDPGLKGIVAPGRQADLVVLGADPGLDVSHFANVYYTIRSGRVIYERETTAVDPTRKVR